MIVALKIIIGTFCVFTALGLLCAVRIGRRAKWASLAPADPYFHPFGEMPVLSAEQLDRIRPRDFSAGPLRRSFAVRDNHSAGGALRPADADGGGHVPSWLAPISRFFAWRRR
jgi:hypothetical protein